MDTKLVIEQRKLDGTTENSDHCRTWKTVRKNDTEKRNTENTLGTEIKSSVWDVFSLRCRICEQTSDRCSDVEV